MNGLSHFLLNLEQKQLPGEACLGKQSQRNVMEPSVLLWIDDSSESFGVRQESWVDPLRVFENHILPYFKCYGSDRKFVFTAPLEQQMQRLVRAQDRSWRHQGPLWGLSTQRAAQNSGDN